MNEEHWNPNRHLKVKPAPYETLVIPPTVVTTVCPSPVLKPYKSAQLNVRRSDIELVPSKGSKR